MQEKAKVSPRARRILEIVRAVDGVQDARVWLWDGRVAVGVRGVGYAPAELLRRTERSLLALREPEETWDFGILEDAQAS